MQNYSNHTQSVPGSAPGIEHHEIACLPSRTGQAHIACLDYSPGQVAAQAIDNLEDFVGRHRPEWAVVRWISVDGLADLHAIQALATKYDLHPLVVEDMLQKN